VYLDFNSSKVSFDKGTLRHQQAASGVGQQLNVLPQDSQTRMRGPLFPSMMQSVLPQVRGVSIRSQNRVLESYTGRPVFNRLLQYFQAPPLTRERVVFACTVAVVTDVVQLLLGPLGWAFTDQALDIVAMVLTTRALGFHPLLLPTFVLEFLPVTDMLPTWTGCVAILIALRKNQQPSIPPLPESGRVIDISEGRRG
jgi:hypothetical protein